MSQLKSLSYSNTSIMITTEALLWQLHPEGCCDTFNAHKVSDDTALLLNTLLLTLLSKRTGLSRSSILQNAKEWRHIPGDPRGYVIKLTGLGLKPNPYYLLQNTVTSSPVVVMRYPKFSETSFRWSQRVWTPVVLLQPVLCGLTLPWFTRKTEQSLCLPYL